MFGKWYRDMVAVIGFRRDAIEHHHPMIERKMGYGSMLRTEVSLLWKKPSLRNGGVLFTADSFQAGILFVCCCEVSRTVRHICCEFTLTPHNLSELQQVSGTSSSVHPVIIFFNTLSRQHRLLLLSYSS